MADESTGFDIPELKAEFVFRQRPVAIPGDLRIGWRIGLLVLLMSGCCKSGRTSLTRLHVLSWGIRTQESRDALIAASNNEVPPGTLLVRFEPFLNRAIDFALGEGLISRTDGARIELSQKGRTLATELVSDQAVYVTEKRFIETVRFRVTEKLVDGIFGGKP